MELRHTRFFPVRRGEIDLLGVLFRRRCFQKDQLVRTGEELAVGQESRCQATHGRRWDG